MPNLKTHMEHLGYLAETRKWLAGANLSLADFAAAAHLSSLDFAGEVDWSLSPPAKEWYARIKSRPSFRPILGEPHGRHRAARALCRSGFLSPGDRRDAAAAAHFRFGL